MGTTSNTDIDSCKSSAVLKRRASVGGIDGHLDNGSLKISNCKWCAKSEVKFGLDFIPLNENVATYAENLKLESVIDIVNEENKFKVEGEKVLIKWQ